MAITTGSVDCLNIGDDFAFFRLLESDGGSETFVLWFNPRNLSAFTRLRHSMWLTLLRDAFATGDPVQVSHGAGDATVTAIRVDKP